jgi:hypothetical protein
MLFGASCNDDEAQEGLSSTASESSDGVTVRDLESRPFDGSLSVSRRLFRCTFLAFFAVTVVACATNDTMGGRGIRRLVPVSDNAGLKRFDL